jgi:uncharacterized protein
MSNLPAPNPRPSRDNRPFWEGTAQGKLLLPRCEDCGFVIWYPRFFCPECASSNVTWFEASGRGTVYACTVTRRGPGPYRDAGPYVLAYVELEEGPRVMTNIVDCDPHAVKVGQPVEVVFDDTGEGSALYRFRPSS